MSVFGVFFGVKSLHVHGLSLKKRILSQTQIHNFTSSAECEDQLQFLDLVKSLLNVDAAKRISASEALNHPFITMSHLMNSDFKC